jgi:hypothetical protein
MEDKQKVTLYLTSELHRQLKIKAAVEVETMSTIAERALEVYLQHPDLLEQIAEQQGHSHRVYSCPECEHPAIVRDGEMVSIGKQPGLLEEDLVVDVSSRQESLLIGSQR